MTTTRTFVALDLPAAQRAELAAHIAECARRATGHRWVEPDSLHLTLRFLGHLDPEALARVRAELALVRGAAFRLALGQPGAFGPRAAPRVVWIGVEEGLEECARLAAAVEAACRTAGLEPEERAFRAHVTLARARSEGARLPAVPSPPALAAWTAGEFVLYESRLRQQPRYVPLERYRLGG